MQLTIELTQVERLLIIAALASYGSNKSSSIKGDIATLINNMREQIAKQV